MKEYKPRKKLLHDASFPKGESLIPQFNNSLLGAKKAGRTYWKSPSDCITCGGSFYWVHSKNCMHCFASDGDRLGLDT